MKGVLGMAITYDADDREKMYGNRQNTESVSYATRLRQQKDIRLKKIEELEAEIEKCKLEIAELEKKMLKHADSITEAHLDAQGKKISKKAKIIECFNGDFPQGKIAEAVGVSDAYVQKVLCEYRKQMGIKPVSKGQKTRNRILRCLSSGMSITATAIYAEVSPQYVYQVKKEMEARS